MNGGRGQEKTCSNSIELLILENAEAGLPQHSARGVGIIHLKDEYRQAAFPDGFVTEMEGVPSLNCTSTFPIALYWLTYKFKTVGVVDAGTVNWNPAPT